MLNFCYSRSNDIHLTIYRLHLNGRIKMEDSIMVEVCPVNERQINENVTRLNALVTVIVASMFLVTPYRWIIFILPVDFLLRSFWSGRFSPVGTVNKWIVKVFQIGESLINEGPKIFAAQIGLALSGLTVLFYLVNLHFIAFIIAGILVLFALLESTSGYCVACKIYPIIFRNQAR